MNNPNQNKIQTFDQGNITDVKDFRLPSGSWLRARNAITNSISGDIGDLGNEPANSFCSKAPYTIIGKIYLYANVWAIMSTDDVNSEIGIFDQDICDYKMVVNDKCLNFNRKYLITGQSRYTANCTYQIYWSDAYNPDRTLDLSNVPYLKDCYDENGVLMPAIPPYEAVGCITCIVRKPLALDCDAIRLASLIELPCISVKKGTSGGELLNGSYYVTGYYIIGGTQIGDYFAPSNIQSIFEHDNVAGSIDILINSMDSTNFKEFNLVVVSTINQQTSARLVGTYSTHTHQITLDVIDNRWTSVPIENIPLRSPVIETSDAMYVNASYLLRLGTRSKFDFNYQPLANQIVTKWQSVEYPEVYYRKGGNNTGHMRDEVYPFFIRFVYDTGDRSSAYHIPGRPSVLSDFNVVGGDDTAPEVIDGITPYNWIVNNTATITAFPNTALPDGGVVIAEGLMGYWESTEKYPDQNPNMWNSATGNPEFDLCGKQIRHHRFPDNDLGAGPVRNYVNSSPNFNNQPAIRIMGVKFENILFPVDNAGVPIPGIVGYEILRGSREGNKTVVAKGIINNMREYHIDGFPSRTGLYPNHPYNNTGIDNYISTTPTTFASGSISGLNPNPNYRQDAFTFHGPETQFKNPFLSAKEIKVYNELNGFVDANFVNPDKHPKHKLITDLSFVIASIAGIGLATIALNGERRTTRMLPRVISPTGDVFTPASMPGVQFAALTAPALTAFYGGYPTTSTTYYQTGSLISSLAGVGDIPYYNILANTGQVLSNVPGMIGYSESVETINGHLNNTNPILSVAQALPTFAYYLSNGTESILNLIQAILPFRQYALQYQSHCLYDTLRSPQANNNRRYIDTAVYLEPHLQDVGTSFRINNLFRGRSVAVTLSNQSGVNNTFINPIVNDNSNQTVGTAISAGFLTNFDNDNVVDIPVMVKSGIFAGLKPISSCYYAALKQRIRNQYGQIEGIIQVPSTTCPVNVIGSGPFVSPTIFGGDVYVTRYTEKNTMFMFYDWLYGQPDGFEYNYNQHKNVPYPCYWMNTDKYEVFEFINSVISNPTNTGAWIFPSDTRVLDRGALALSFGIKNAYMYLFTSGVRDFYVESEINTDFRDWGEDDAQRHYDPYRFTDLKRLFNSAIIKSGNYFKYDISLSISRTFNNFISWGNVQQRNYDPVVSEKCYVYDPYRIIYSLPLVDSGIGDNWRKWPTNDYQSFNSRPTVVTQIGKNGTMIFFENDSPAQFLGSDQLETDSGTKLTIGDGGLFSQPMQNISNADSAFEYASCQNKFAVVNTPMGLFWIGQNQGKIFQLAGGGPQEMSTLYNRWWFAQYLPYKILEDFPNFELLDNPVIGVGCQATYDSQNGIVYFCKKDWKLKNTGNIVTYNGGIDFTVTTPLGVTIQIQLGNPIYFENASWTYGYDAKKKEWIGLNDWHPELTIPGKNTFLTTQTNLQGEGEMWVHNERCDLYCNYYGIDYPFEVEFEVQNGQQVDVLRSIEYIMEVYKYDVNNHDRFHVLNFNFDEAVIYNTEQCSGLLRLNMEPVNDPMQTLLYPIIQPNQIQILYHKVENKYRFNQFWDITDDRGEFTNAERMIWNTQSNGYIKTLNPANLNYSKPEFQRKDFRHYAQTILLRRRVSGNRKMLIMILNTKNQVSYR